MQYNYKRKTGTATTDGEEIYTVPSDKTISMIGCRAANTDDKKPHSFHITIDDILISGLNTPLPIGSAIDIMVGSKIIVEPSSVIKAFADENGIVDVYISFLEH